MTTDNSYPTTHTHVQSKVSGGTTNSGGLHNHGTSATDKAIAALTARVTKLESAVVAPPAPTIVATAGNGVVDVTWKPGV